MFVILMFFLAYVAPLLILGGYIFAIFKTFSKRKYPFAIGLLTGFLFYLYYLLSGGDCSSYGSVGGAFCSIGLPVESLFYSFFVFTGTTFSILIPVVLIKFTQRFKKG